MSTEYVDVDGSAIGYRPIGSGTPLVLLNRMRGTLDTWDPLFLDELAGARRLVAIWPGFGLSPAPRATVVSPAAHPSTESAADGAVVTL